jgi:hypothetical protein
MVRDWQIKSLRGDADTVDQWPVGGVLETVDFGSQESLRLFILAHQCCGHQSGVGALVTALIVI